jgi:hypothetical protein
MLGIYFRQSIKAPSVHSDNMNPGAAWRANHSSGRNMGIGEVFLLPFSHIVSDVLAGIQLL